MKVLFITTGLATGGAEMMLLKLLQTMDREKIDPYVVSLSGKGTLGEAIERQNIPLFSIDVGGGYRGIKGFADVMRIVNLVQPDIIQGWMLHGNLVASIVGKLKRKKVLWSIRHASLPANKEKKITWLLVRLLAMLSSHTNKIIYNSIRGKAYHESIGFDARKSSVIPNGFDYVLFSPSAERKTHTIRELRLSTDKILVGAVGRYHPIKDHKNLLLAIARVKLDYPDIHCVLAGKGCDNGNIVLLSKIKELGLERDISLLGERGDVPRLLPAFDIFVSSSLSEGFPNVVGEAMACGVPCIVTAVGDCAYIVKDTGYVVPPADSRALAISLVKMIKLGEAERYSLGHRARQRIIDVFAIEAISLQYQALYMEMADA